MGGIYPQGGQNSSVNVAIYNDSRLARIRGLGEHDRRPAGARRQRLGQLHDPNQCDAGPGHYWLSVQGNPADPLGGWAWLTVTPIFNDPAVVEGTANCTTWTTLSNCSGPQYTLDLLFQLLGTTVPTSSDQCKKGGWQNLTDSDGTPFKNQGDCVSYVATGGRNLANG